MNKTSVGGIQCVGRFSFTAPGTMNAAGRTQSIYRTTVTTIFSPTEGVDQYWKQRLAAMRAPRVVDLLPGVRSAWSSRNPEFPKILTLEAAKPVDGGLMVVSREADAGKEGVAETLVKDIVNAYLPTNSRGFCIGYGAIGIEPSQNEHARLTLVDSAHPDVEIQFQTQTVREPDLKTYADLDEEKSVAAEQGGTISLLREGERTAAQLSGKELWISAAVPGEPQMVRFTWHYPGVAASSTRPSVTIVGSAGAGERAQLEVAWESLLTSLREVPLSEGPR